MERFRSDQKVLLHSLVRRVSRLAVYAIDLDDLEPPDPATCLAVQELEADDLRTMTVPIPGFRERQLQRLAQFGTSYAHGFYLDGQLAHVAWLLPSAAMVGDAAAAFRPRDGEAEITGAETLPAYRGKGISPDVIRCLLEQARDCGMRRVYMKAAFHDAPSRSDIEKAGLRLRGSVLIVSLPRVDRHVVWRSFR